MADLGPWLAWWLHADAVVRGVFVLLVALSVLSWAVILYKTAQLVWALRCESLALRLLEDGALTRPRLERIPRGSVARLLGEEALTYRSEAAGSALERLRERLDLLRVRRRVELENQLSVLATIGNTAPFIGLFGTVWGIMGALQGLGDGANLSIAVVSGPVGEALTATAGGLFTAIPAVVGYNLLVRLIRRISVAAAASQQVVVEQVDALVAGPQGEAARGGLA